MIGKAETAGPAGPSSNCARRRVLLIWDEPTSFEGRYFGPISQHAIIDRAKHLWTFDKP